MITKEEILRSAMDRANSANIKMRDEQLRDLKRERNYEENQADIEYTDRQIEDLERYGLKPTDKQTTLYAVMYYSLDNISPSSRTEQEIKANVEVLKDVVRDLINQGESIAVTNCGKRRGAYHLFSNTIETAWIKNGIPLFLLQTALDNGRKEQVQAALNGQPDAGSGTIFHALSRGEEYAAQLEKDAVKSKSSDKLIEAVNMKTLYSNCALSILEFAKTNNLQIPLDYKSKNPEVQEKIDEVTKPMRDEIQAANAARRAAQEEYRIANLKRIAEAKAAAQQQEPAKPVDVKPTAPQKEQEPAKVDPQKRPTLQRTDAVKDFKKDESFVKKVGGRKRSEALTSNPPKPTEALKQDGHAAKVQMGTHRQPTQRQ